MASRFLLVTAAAAAVAGLGGDGPAAPTPESRLTAQQLADRFLEIHAKLDKPGELPEYRLGEPVVVELEMKNRDLGHMFWIPLWTQHNLIDLKLWYTAGAYMVTAKRDGRAVPLTERGRAAEEYMERGVEALSCGLVYTFVGEWPRPPELRNVAGGRQSTLAKAVANLTCDMTEPGDYELEVKFLMKVHQVEGTVTKVVRDKALRLRVLNRFEKIDEP